MPLDPREAPEAAAEAARRVLLPAWFDDFWWGSDARFKSAEGGRGSTKTDSIATAIMLDCTMQRLRWFACRETMASLDDSSKPAIVAAIERAGLQGWWQEFRTELRCLNGSIIRFAGLERNLAALRGKHGVDGLWLDEAQYHSHDSARGLTRTLRKRGSGYVYSWNAEDPDAWVYDRFVANPRAGELHVEVNYYDNPWFRYTPLHYDRRADKTAMPPDEYAHVWLGKPLSRGPRAYMDMAAWQATAVDWSPLPGSRCHVGVDVGTEDDLTAATRTFKIDTHGMEPIVYQDWRFWATETSFGRNAKTLLPWREWIEVCDGPGRLQDSVRDWIAEIDGEFDLAEVAFDRTAFEPIYQHLVDWAIPHWRYPQGAQGMDPPMSMLEDLLGAGLYAHQDHPIARWCMRNVKVLRNVDGLRRPQMFDGDKGRQKIDGAIAAFQSLASAMKDDGL